MRVYWKILVVLFISRLFFSLSIYSQPHNTDSLENLLVSANDKNKVGYFNLLSKEYHALNDFERSLENGKKALELAKKLGNRGEKAEALFNIGNSYLLNKSYEEAIEFLHNALTEYKELQNAPQISQTFIKLGLAYYKQGVF